jgi:hypothetical protein
MEFQAMHVEINYPWTGCSNFLSYSYSDLLASMLPVYLLLHLSTLPLAEDTLHLTYSSGIATSSPRISLCLFTGQALLKFQFVNRIFLNFIAAVMLTQSFPSPAHVPG